MIYIQRRQNLWLENGGPQYQFGAVLYPAVVSRPLPLNALLLFLLLGQPVAVTQILSPFSPCHQAQQLASQC